MRRKITTATGMLRIIFLQERLVHVLDIECLDV